MTYGRTFTKEEIPLMYNDRFRAARALGYRSGLEVRIARELDEQGVPFKYEEFTIQYTQPSEERRYTPDIVLENGIVIELKGIWETADRKKLRLVKENHPNLDLRIVFSNASAKISKKSKTTYADICTKLKIPFASKSIPKSWIDEAPHSVRTDALAVACGH